MLPYRKFRYYYPPRPDLALPPSTLNTYNSTQWVAEAKLNGSNGTVYANKNEVQIYNRHAEEFKGFRVDVIHLLPLDKGWVVVNGEYMNKSQKDLNGILFNHKFVIFDILVYESKYLIGTTFEERLKLLNQIFKPTKKYDPYLWQLTNDVYLVKPIKKDFEKHFEIVSKNSSTSSFTLSITGSIEGQSKPYFEASFCNFWEISNG